MNPTAHEQLVFGVLMAGPNRSRSAAEAEQIQKGHLGYMESLHKRQV